MWRHGLGSSQGPMLGFCEYGYEVSGSIKTWYCLLKTPQSSANICVCIHMLQEAVAAHALFQEGHAYNKM